VKTNDEESYIQKLSVSAIDGGLWGDYITIYRISEYLHCSIDVWNKINGQIMVNIKQI